MKEIKKIEEFIKDAEKNTLKDLTEYGINHTLYMAYRHSQEAGNDLLDFDEVIWNHDIPELAEAFKENGIKEFTISSTFSSLIETLAEFQTLGIEMACLTTVKARYKDWETGENAEIPAIKMTVKEA